MLILEKSCNFKNNVKIVICLLLLTLISSACSSHQSESEFSYDPTIPYPVFDRGDFWLDKFDQRGLQNARVYDDRMYCNTIETFGDSYLYCFDLKSGTVLWRTLVSDFATQPVTEWNDKVIYSSFLGEFQAFDKQGNELWAFRCEDPYGGHWVDPNDGDIKVSTPYGNRITCYKMNGEFYYRENNPILKKIIEKEKYVIDTVTNQYHITYNNWNYTIKVTTPEYGENHLLEISKTR